MSNDPTESTASLLARMRDGDDDARARLATRYVAILKRWAHGRIPPRARRLADTEDLVQTTVLRALEGLGRFEPRREGAFLAYLRTILMNELRNALRRLDQEPRPAELPDDLRDGRPSPLSAAIGAEAMARYEIALAGLTEDQRQAVILRVELGYSYEEVAGALGSPSVDAARMLVVRALARLSEAMSEHA